MTVKKQGFYKEMLRLREDKQMVKEKEKTRERLSAERQQREAAKRAQLRAELESISL